MIRLTNIKTVIDVPGTIDMHLEGNADREYADMTKKSRQGRVPQETPFPGAHILVADDEPSIRRYLSKMLESMGYRITTVTTGEHALDQIAADEIDLAILDLNMPGIDGTEVLQAAQSIAPDTVFIILTGYGTLESAIAGIRHGAHDYLLKPSSTSEIASAVEAGLAERRIQDDGNDPIDLLQRALATLQESKQHPQASASSSDQRFIQVPGILIDLWKRLVVIDGEPAELTSTEFDILTCLARRRNRVISCQEIVAEIRGHVLDERDARSFLRSHIYRLRQKIEQAPENPKLICTVRGAGYMLTI